MGKQQQSSGVNIGISSIIVMFVVIAMTVFAVLSLSTALQEEALAEKFAAAIEDYWAADAEATGIANSFGGMWRDSDSRDTTVQSLADDLGVAYVSDGADIVISYSVPIRNRAGSKDGEEAASISDLFVKIRMKNADSPDAEFSVEEWRVVVTDENWEPDNHLPVWQP